MSAPDLDGWKELIEDARSEHEPMPSVVYPGVTWCASEESAHWPCVAFRLADALDSAVAHLGRLEAQRDEALAIAAKSLASGWDGADDAEDAFSDALRDLVRVLSRTEDGTNG